MKQFLERRSHFFAEILKNLPVHELLVGYGSGVFHQQGSSLNRMLDFLVIADDTNKFHTENIKMNRTHYTSSIFPTDNYHLSKIKYLNKNYFPLFYFTQNKLEDIPYKYGVIQSSELEIELEKWRNFAIAGRFQKPLFFVGQKTAFLENLIDKNRKNAVC